MLRTVFLVFLPLLLIPVVASAQYGKSEEDLQRELIREDIDAGVRNVLPIAQNSVSFYKLKPNIYFKIVDLDEYSTWVAIRYYGKAIGPTPKLKQRPVYSMAIKHKPHGDLLKTQYLWLGYYDAKGELFAWKDSTGLRQKPITPKPEPEMLPDTRVPGVKPKQQPPPAVR